MSPVSLPPSEIGEHVPAAERAEGAAERKVPPAACDRSIPATECLAWHIIGRIPDTAKVTTASSGRSCRLLCPNHADAKPSLTISTGDNAPLIWHCHICKEAKRLEVRASLIRIYDLDPKCLPMTRQERAELETMIDAVFASEFTPCTKLICIRALHDGMRGALPTAPALIHLGARAGAARATAFRARDELAGLHLDHLFIPKQSKSVKNPEVVSAFRGVSPVSDCDSVSNGDSPQSQVETGDDRTPKDKPATSVKPAA